MSADQESRRSQDELIYRVGTVLLNQIALSGADWSGEDELRDAVGHINQFDTALEYLLASRWITPVAGTGRYRLLPEGEAERLRRAGLAHLNEVNVLLAELRAEQAHLADAVGDAVQKQLELGHKQATFDARLNQATRDFYVQVIPLFALVVSAFALVITGVGGTAPVAAAVTSPVALTWADFGNLLAIAFARLFPLAALFIVLVGGTLWATVRLTRQPETRAPLLRPALRSWWRFWSR